MGIRLALGARGADVIAMIFRQGLIELAVGRAFGVLLTGGISQALRIVLFHVRPLDPWTFGEVAGVLGLVDVAACLVPTLRAARTDPLVALRQC